MRHVLAVIAVALVLSAVSEAHACKVGAPQRHTPDESRRATDAQVPRLAAAPAVAIHRGMDNTRTGCDGGGQTSSCDDIGSIRIAVPASDDQTPEAELGFRLVVTKGMPPEGLEIPRHDVRAREGNIVLFWVDHGKTSYSFVMSVAPVDAAGNVGTSVDVSVSSDGELGCSVGGAARPGLWLVVLLLAFWGRLRRTRRPA